MSTTSPNSNRDDRDATEYVSAARDGGELLLGIVFAVLLMWVIAIVVKALNTMPGVNLDLDPISDVRELIRAFF